MRYTTLSPGHQSTFLMHSHLACAGVGLTSRFKCSKCTMFPRSWALPASSPACSSCMLRALPRAAWPELPLLCSSSAASAEALPCSAFVLTALGMPALDVLLHLSEQNFTSSQQDSHFLRLQVRNKQGMQTLLANKSSRHLSFWAASHSPCEWPIAHRTGLAGEICLVDGFAIGVTHASNDRATRKSVARRCSQA